MEKVVEVGWGIRQRFEFIEWRCYWDGRLNREDLENEFSISTPQASIDLRNYREIAPGNIEYNSTEKAFIATSNFRPQFLRLSPERYLLQLLNMKLGLLEKNETWFGELPAHDVVPQLARGPDAYILRGIIKGIRTKGMMEINYQSLTNTRVRKIVPHALANDGFRWHVRAWCPERMEHRDYVLGRILSFSQPTPTEVQPPSDLVWHTEIELRLTAHPNLDVQQRQAVERDFRLNDGLRLVKTRLSLAYYFIHRHNLDLRNNEIPPQRMQLFLQNLEEYEKLKGETMSQAKAIVEHWLRNKPQTSL